MSKRINKNAPYWVMMRTYDKQTCEWALEHCGGHVESAAALLGINKAYLYKKIRDLDIDLKHFKKKAKAKRDQAAEPSAADTGQSA